jgi:poly-gamma-glutamate synthesis protein (capsule biosynthesis protein)
MAASPLRIVLLGQALLQNKLDTAQWPEQVAFTRLLKGADVCFTDLETAIKGPNAGTPLRTGEFMHAADSGVIDCLHRVGVNMMATSNNHAFDFGPGGIRDALEALDARGITHAGTGLTLANASGAGIRKTPHGTVGLVSMAMGNVREGGDATDTQPGVNEVHRDGAGVPDAGDVARYLGAISAAAKSCDVVIAYHHNHYWEKNMADTPPWQRALAHQAIEAGAGIFASHGAPLMQGIEIYGGKPIFYDLGGFFFQTVTEPGHYPPEVWQSVVADTRWDGDSLVQIEFVPVQLNDTGLGGPADMVTRGTPKLAVDADARAILTRLALISTAFGTKIDLVGNRAVLRLRR